MKISLDITVPNDTNKDALIEQVQNFVKDRVREHSRNEKMKLHEVEIENEKDSVVVAEK